MISGDLVTRVKELKSRDHGSSKRKFHVPGRGGEMKGNSYNITVALVFIRHWLSEDIFHSVNRKWGP